MSGTERAVDLPVLHVAGYERRIVVVDVAMVDRQLGAETVAVTANGPDGTAQLTGSLRAVMQLVWSIDGRLHQLARGDI